MTGPGLEYGTATENSLQLRQRQATVSGAVENNMPPTPTVQRIFKIFNRAEAIERFEVLEKSLGNVKRRFHGTKALCGLGVLLNGAACMRPECNACNICANGFEVRGEHYSRFGDGVYTSATSGKSNDYAGNDNKAHGKTFRCMFLCKVAAGKTYKIQLGNLPADQCPPPGYDSVVGDVGGVGGLNYDELCDSVLPAYWIVYQLN
ncbi:hypothetical protein, variant [Sphaeroforma arctica JP610]|uniref:PARP catalytic domain-containing protein n=1 Tax=Sphaeroforma arctica JP610 TaxID=667725 RepID=A0A0L0GAI4_9EUKA|nr:hypothetical protein, variant [Sphaeroforma arctica JP610]KNC85919.1 hypothetical protein, variant [Sphaeroforma arctica JP610]|eukprot:XP_014159821.1 hypothetical protein, variant [Sphaeroforma arctica JP610]